MTANGFIQIALYCVIVTLLVKPFGFYITANARSCRHSCFRSSASFIL
jgi:hypothetical protein